MNERQLERYLITRFRNTFSIGEIFKLTSPGRRFLPDMFMDTGAIIAYAELKADKDADIHSGQIREILRIRNRGRIADILWSEKQINNFLEYLYEVHDHVSDNHPFKTHSEMFDRLGIYNFNLPKETDSKGES